MPNTNGLICGSITTDSGDIDSNIYLRKGDVIPAPIVTSPLIVRSASGLQASSLSVNNAGLTAITAGNEIDLNPGQDDSAVINISRSAPGSGGLIVVNSGAPTEEAKVFADSGGSLQLESTTGLINMYADNGVKVKPQNQTTGGATITLQNGTSSATPTYYTIYNTSVTGGGTTAGQLDVFGYSGAGFGTIRRCLAIAPTGDSITLGDAVGCAVSSTGSFIAASGFQIRDSSQYAGAVALNGTSVTVGVPQGIASDTLIFLNTTSAAPAGKLYTTFVNTNSFTINSTSSESNLTVQYIVINRPT
jgi:hypothetical protein